MKRTRLRQRDIDTAFTGPWARQYPPILNVVQAAQLAGVSPSTVYDWSHRDLLANCAARRGKRLRILRDRYIQFLFPELSDSPEGA